MRSRHILIRRHLNETQGSWPTCATALWSQPRSTLFSAQPTLTYFTCQVPSGPITNHLPRKPFHMFSIKSTTIICDSGFSANLNWDWNERFCAIGFLFGLALPGPWCSCLHATWCTRRLEWLAPTPAIKNLAPAADIWAVEINIVMDSGTLCRMLVPVLPKELSVFPHPATSPVWPARQWIGEETGKSEISIYYFKIWWTKRRR